MAISPTQDRQDVSTRQIAYEMEMQRVLPIEQSSLVEGTRRGTNLPGLYRSDSSPGANDGLHCLDAIDL